MFAAVRKTFFSLMAEVQYTNTKEDHRHVATTFGLFILSHDILLFCFCPLPF